MTSAGLYTRMVELSEQGVPFVLATVTGVRGSSPRDAGAKMLILADGTTQDTIGGGVLEREAIADALELIVSDKPSSRTYRLQPKDEEGLGSLCGGEVTVFFEPHLASRTVLVVGAGHVGQKLSALVAMLDRRGVVLDRRPDMVTRERFPQAAKLVCGEASRAADLVPIDGRTAVVIVTPSSEEDEQALRAVIGSAAGYIGMIGSRRKVRTIFERLRQDGTNEELLARVHAPVGIDIGAETPAELALCIMAEIVAEENGRLAAGPSAAARGVVGPPER
jgi:xanthine dehydrogenase accessory factor